MKKISHLKNRKKPRIVDISKKNITLRLATAISSLKFSKKTFEKINRLKSEKGEIINIATIAGIMATKKTSGQKCNNTEMNQPFKYSII